MEAAARPFSPGAAGPALRIAFASIHRSTDVLAWSGTVYFLSRALRQRGLELDPVDELQQVRLLLNKAVNRLYRMTGRDGPMPVERSVHMAARFGREIDRFVDQGRHDLVFSPSSIPLALVKTSVPKVFFTDATFADMLELYPAFGDLSEARIREGHELEHAALANCDLAIYSSRWAARSAMERYGAAPHKVKVVPFGSNLDLRPEQSTVEAAVMARPHHRCDLLFLGVDWSRKGGDLALEVVRELNRAGLPATLTVVGCLPPPYVDLDPELLQVVPFVDKSSTEGQRRLMDLIIRSHFLLLPSQAECFGIVYAEASSMGVPSLARATGGVADAVRNGRNGFVFPADAPPTAYAAKVLALMADREAYRALARSSFQEHRAHLDWEVSAATIHRHLSDLVR